MLPEILVDNLQRVYRVPERTPGLISALRSLVKPSYTDVAAVKGISFTIERGEIVGFIGPNGAGKTTTLKMLSGLLYPTAGTVRVKGFDPSSRKPEFLRSISMVMGNKSQMTWENTVLDSFYILKEIYHVPDVDFQQRLDELVALLEIDGLLTRLVRNLSLGERAKCEFAASLLHCPDILFLDEPTLGLDVSTQLRLREFVKEYNRRYGTTVIVTSHYMADIMSLCPRVILIHEGQLAFDGQLQKLAERIAPFKLVHLTLREGEHGFQTGTLQELQLPASVLEQAERTVTLRVKKEDILTLTTALIERFAIADLTIEDPAIEAVIDQVYREGVSA